MIRDMKIKDYAAVDELMQQLHKIHVQGRPDLYVDKEHPYSRNDFIQKVKDGNCISILAEQDGEIIGFCFASMREHTCMVNKRTAYMDDLFVSKKARRKGIASALFKVAVEKAIALGAKRLDLMVWNFNESALAFYRSLGMTEQRYILEKELE